MKFEKLSENKIRITLNTQDLAEKHIDFHSFMSNSLETQNLFLDMLDEAEKTVGFNTKDYKIRVEALAMSDGNFVVTVTRITPNIDIDSAIPKTRRLKTRRKIADATSTQVVYEFNNFEDFCSFSNFVSDISKFSTIAKTTILYLYKEKYYLVFSNIDLNHPQIDKFYCIATEFATYLHNSELFSRKLIERGTLIFKNNALKNCIKYF